MTEGICALCGLPLRFGSHAGAFDGQTLHFCCTGCRMVFAMLTEAADGCDPSRFRQTELYRRCVAAGVVPASEDDLVRMHTQSPPHRREPADTDPGGHTLALHYDIEGMWCPACAWVVEDALLRLDGVVQAACNFAADTLDCRYDPVKTTPHAVAAAVNQLGYAVAAEERDAAARRYRRNFVRLFVTVMLSVNIMMLSWALYSGFFTQLSTQDAAFISWPMAVMATVVMVYGGGPVFRKAWSGLRAGAPGMEVLILMGSGSAFGYSFFNLMQGSIHLYFDTASMLLALLLLGKLLEERAKMRVRRDLKRFMALRPRKVRLCGEGFGHGRFVAAEQLAVGDCFRVQAGETVPADGVILSGGARVDTAAITGESKPVSKGPGDALVSGFRLISGDAVVTARRVGPDALLGQMIAIVHDSLGRRTPLESKTDRVLALFVPVIAVLALGTCLAVFLNGGSLDQAIVRGVTVLVIACPCALGIAVPLTRVAAIAGAGRQGLLVRGFEAFERMAAIDTLVFDKTGTLTRGRWRLEQVTARALCQQEAVSLALALEAGVDHAVAHAVAAYADAKGVAAAQVEQVRVHPQGVGGIYKGRAVRIGSRSFALSAGGDDRAEADLGQRESAGGLSTVYLSVDGDVGALFGFGDTLKPGLPELMQALRAQGFGVHLVSGDTPEAAGAVAAAVGIPHAAGALLPDAKARYISQLQDRGSYVLIVGDGINDAPAMARADLALAIPSNAPLAREAADVTLMRGDPRQLLDLRAWSLRVNRKVSQNIWCAWVYNLISIPIAMSGLLSPLVAVTAMLLSSLTVIGNTVLLVRDTASRGKDFEERTAERDIHEYAAKP